MKTLDELKVIIEQPVAQGSNETKFINKYGKYSIPKENVKILNRGSILLNETYGDFSMTQRHSIPEEANAILLGQKGLFPGIVEKIIYSGNCCEIKK